MAVIEIEYCSSLCYFAHCLQYENISPATIEQTKKFIADYIAASYAGYMVNRQFNEAVLSVVKTEGGAEESSVLCQDRKYPASAAAYMNAVYAHGADMDDGNRKAAGHIGAHVISAVFAVAEKLGAKWSDVIVAVNVGYEFFNRIVGAAQPGLYNKGFHSTGIGGAMACAAACAKLMGLNADGIYTAVSLAAVQSSGLIIIDESGQSCKPINAANAAKCGVVSAMLAQNGVDAPKYPLESKKGWFSAFADDVNPDILLESLGETFTINESYLKQYPSCRHTHSSMDAAKELREMYLAAGYTVKDIATVDVSIYPSAIKSAGRILRPENEGEAKFSLHYTIACMLKHGIFGLDDLQPVYDDDTQSLIDHIRLIVDESMENRHKGIRGSSVTLTMKDGTVYTSYVPVPKGEGDFVLNWDDMKDKMRSCSVGVLSMEEADAFICMCMNIDGDALFSIRI